MALSLFKVILVVFHVIYNVYVETRRLINFIIQYLGDLCYGPVDLKSEIEYVRKERAALEKSLTHIAVILGHEVVSVKDIVRIALWSHAAGASYVSFYDHTGKLKKNKSALDEALNSICQGKSHIPKTNGYINGFVGKQYPHIMLLDISDGKPAIVKAAQEICEKALKEEISASDLDLDLFHKYVMKESGLPEPELALYCGDIVSLYGFLPWHSRVTEFLPLNSHHDVSVRTFTSLLRKYNKCEKRLGT